MRCSYYLLLLRAIEARISVVLKADAGATGDYTATILKFDAAHFHYFGDDQPGLQCNDPWFARTIVTCHKETVFHVLPSCWCLLQVLGTRCFSVDVFCPLRVTGERLFGDICVCFQECVPVPTPSSFRDFFFRRKMAGPLSQAHISHIICQMNPKYTSRAVVGEGLQRLDGFHCCPPSLGSIK